MLKLTEELRLELRKPMGRIFPSEELLNAVGEAKPVVCVGDYSALAFLKLGRRPDIVVYDLKTRREPVSQETREALEGLGKAVRVANPPGTITGELIEAVRESLKKGTGLIFIDGEDDLAALVALTVAPDGSAVVYGLPAQGAVVVHIKEKVRNKAKRLFERMQESYSAPPPPPLL